MSLPVNQDLDRLCNLAVSNCSNRGTELVSAGQAACIPVTIWQQWLQTNQTTGTADCLLTGAASAAREGVACVTLGLVRPALSSLRLQIDLMLAWLFFKDHAVEWQRVQETGDGYKMKTDLLKYIAEMNPKFGKRSGLLLGIKTRTVDDPYRLLSAHIHGQSEATIPQVEKLSDIIGVPSLQDDVIKLQAECSEYISDILWSNFCDRWASIPNVLRAPLEARFKSKEQKAEFFA